MGLGTQENLLNSVGCSLRVGYHHSRCLLCDEVVLMLYLLLYTIMGNLRMKCINRLIFIACVLLLFIVCTGCNNTEMTFATAEKTSHLQQENFRFIVAADPQLFRGKTEDLDRAIQSINDFEPDFIVMCGDLIETPSNPEQISAYKDSVSKLSSDITLYNIAGNHDLGRPAKIKNIQTYQEHFGKLWYHFDRSDSRFILLSSDILQNENIPMNQLQREWLAGLLEQSQSASKKQMFVFMHHPLYLNTPDEPDAYSNMPVQIRRELLGLFVKYNVQAVFSGHYHNNKVNSYQGVNLITTNSITVPMGEVAAGFRVVEVSQDGYEQKYYTIEEPNKQDIQK
jgi:predicted MPP superfamily phosphohydrolase